MRALDNFWPEQINMSLLKRYWFGQNIEASSHKVDVDNFVIAYYAVDSLIVIATYNWWEVDLNADKWVSLHNAFRHRESKDVEPIWQELEADWKVRVVVNCQ